MSTRTIGKPPARPARGGLFTTGPRKAPVRRPAPLLPRAPGPSGPLKKRAAGAALPRLTRRWRLFLAGVILGGLAGGYLAWQPSAEGLVVEGPEPATTLGGPDLADLSFAVAGGTPEELAGVSARLDGRELSSGLSVSGDTVTVQPGTVPDGRHALEVTLPRDFLPDRQVVRRFTVDTAVPELVLGAPTEPVPPDEPLSVVGTVDADAEVTADGAPVRVENGSFTLAWPEPPGQAVRVVATDALGNVSEATLAVELALPGVAGGPPMRGVHVTAAAWGHDGLREGVLTMIDEGRINTIELDLKDESGVIGYDSQVPLALEAGAVQPSYDLAATVNELHDRGVRVVGRLVAFRDPVLAEHAVATEAMDWVVQTPTGELYADYGGYTNPASAEVQAYNIDIAVEAARAGVDDILYDYIRRPDGPIDTMVFPGLQGKPEVAILEFLADGSGPVREAGARVGASVFGISATRPDSVAQPITAMAEYLDYVAPMVYPSHWARGEYNVAHPNAQPYDIVRASLPDFQNAVRGTDATVVPWLQDFTLGVTYGPAEIQAQVQAAADLGIHDFLLWDPAVTYTQGGLEPQPSPSPVE